MAVPGCPADHEPMSERGLHSIVDDLSDTWLEDWAAPGSRRSRHTWRSTPPSSPSSRFRTRSARPASAVRSRARDRERSCRGSVRASRRGRRPLERPRHPFYSRWECGELTRDELAYYAGEYRHAVVALAGLAALGLRRRPCAEEAAHVDLWDDFAVALDADLDRAPRAETSACVDAWSGTGAEGAAALFAIEAAQPDDLADEARRPRRARTASSRTRRARATSRCTPSATTSTPSSRAACSSGPTPTTSRPPRRGCRARAAGELGAAGRSRRRRVTDMTSRRDDGASSSTTSGTGCRVTRSTRR